MNVWMYLINEWMNEWVDELMNGLIDGGGSEWIN